MSKIGHVTTKREATMGKTLKLHKEIKGQAAGIIDPAMRRHFLNMNLQILAEEEKRKLSRNKQKPTSDSLPEE